MTSPRILRVFMPTTVWPAFRRTWHLLAASALCAGIASAVPAGITPVAVEGGDTQPVADGPVLIPTIRRRQPAQVASLPTTLKTLTPTD